MRNPRTGKHILEELGDDDITHGGVLKRHCGDTPWSDDVHAARSLPAIDVHGRIDADVLESQLKEVLAACFGEGAAGGTGSDGDGACDEVDVEVLES